MRSGTPRDKVARRRSSWRRSGATGAITAAEAALETSLSVEEADRMLSGLAVKGHLEVRVDGARIAYSLWEGRG